MIDEKRVIKKLQSRIDDFVLKHPDKKDCEAVQTVEEFIQILEEECKEQNNGWILCSQRLPDIAGYEVLATLENKYGQRRCAIVFAGYGDFKWHCKCKEFNIDAWKVVAWQPLPEVFKERED